VIIPNSAIYSSNIVNYSKRPTRRIDMTFSIGYEDDLRAARDIIAAIIKDEPRILPEPDTLIAVGELATNSVNFFVRPWVKTEDYWDVKFALTEKIKLAFDANGITIPFPPIHIHSNKAPA
jgi:small conductance mechanosensitive channel